MHSNFKASTDPIVYQTHLTNILFDHDKYETIYTDGSKTEDGVGSAFVHGGISGVFNLPKVAMAQVFWPPSELRACLVSLAIRVGQIG